MDFILFTTVYAICALALTAVGYMLFKRYRRARLIIDGFFLVFAVAMMLSEFAIGVIMLAGVGEYDRFTWGGLLYFLYAAMFAWLTYFSLSALKRHRSE